MSKMSTMFESTFQALPTRRIATTLVAGALVAGSALPSLALTAADRLWTEHPDWSFGQCLDAIHAARSYCAAR